MPLVAASDSNIKVLNKKLKFDQHLFLKRKLNQIKQTTKY